MAGVYGNFVENFSELFQAIDIWSSPDETDVRTIVGVAIPTYGVSLRHNAVGNGNTVVEEYDDLDLYISDAYRDDIHIGDYCTSPVNGRLMRVKTQVAYPVPAGYTVYRLARVTGNNYRQNTGLTVKGAEYD